MHFIMTTDVESFFIPLNRDSDVAKQIYEVGLPHLLDLYARRRGERYMRAQKRVEKFWRELSKWLISDLRCIRRKNYKLWKPLIIPRKD